MIWKVKLKWSEVLYIVEKSIYVCIYIGMYVFVAVTVLLREYVCMYMYVHLLQIHK